MRTAPLSFLFLGALLLGCSMPDASAPTLQLPSSLELPPTIMPQIPSMQIDTAEPSLDDAATLVPIALVLVGDDGANGELLGCGDSLVYSSVPSVGGGSPVERSMRALFAHPQRADGPNGELMNTATRLAFDGASVTDGVLTVQLTGQPLLGGVCEAPRLQAQIEGTALMAGMLSSADPISSVVVSLNGSTAAWKVLFSFKGI